MSFLRKVSRIAILPLTLAGCIGGGPVTEVEPLGPPGSHFPKVTGTNLLGDQVTFPDAFVQAQTLVAIGFEDQHKHPLNDWIVKLVPVRAVNPELGFFEVPVIYQLKPWSRMFLNNAMRMGVTEDEARQQTVTVYLDRDDFKAAMDLPSLKEIYLFVVDPDGEVLWRYQGTVSEDALASLSAFLAAS